MGMKKSLEANVSQFDLGDIFFVVCDRYWLLFLSYYHIRVGKLLLTKKVSVYEKVSIHDCCTGYGKLYRPDEGERNGGRIC